MTPICVLCGCELEDPQDRLPWHDSKGKPLGHVHASCAFQASVAREKAWLDLRDRILAIATGRVS